jgi:hypothetical protein
MQPGAALTEGLADGRHLFVISTAASGGFSDDKAPALPVELVEQMVTWFERQYPGSPVQLLGPDLGTEFRRRYERVYTLRDRMDSPLDSTHLEALGDAGATMIGVTPDIGSMLGEDIAESTPAITEPSERNADGTPVRAPQPEVKRLRTLQLTHDGTPPDGPVEHVRAKTQQWDLPTDWAVRQEAVAAAVSGPGASPAVLRESLRSWRAEVTDYRNRTNQDRVRPGLVDPVRQFRNGVAAELGKQLDEGLQAVERGLAQAKAWWDRAGQDVDFHVRGLAQLTPTELFGMLRRAVDDNKAFGALVMPGSIKGVELSPVQQDELKRTKEISTVGREIRPNPALVSLADLTAEHFTDRPDATWQIIITRAHALPRFGTENFSDAYPEQEWVRLSASLVDSARRTALAELRRGPVGLQKPQESQATPEDPAPGAPGNKPLTAEQHGELVRKLGLGSLLWKDGRPLPFPSGWERVLAMPEVRRALTTPQDFDGLGHPTIGGRYDKSGKFLSDHLQTGGEDKYNKRYGILVLNDMSGRSMSPKVRDTDEPNFREWISNLARMASAQTVLDWEVGLSKQAAKSAIKTNPDNIRALAQVAVIKEGLAGAETVERLLGEVRSRTDKVTAALPAGSDALAAWTSLGETLQGLQGVKIAAAQQAIDAYASTVETINSARAGKPSLVPDPATLFPLEFRESETALWVGSKNPTKEAAIALKRQGESPVKEVWYRDKPDPEDISLLKSTLLSRPVDEIRTMVYRPTGIEDLTGQKAQSLANQSGLTVEILKAKLPPTDSYLIKLPENASWRSVDGEERLSVKPADPLHRKHVDYQPGQTPVPSRPVSPAPSLAQAASSGQAPEQAGSSRNPVDTSRNLVGAGAAKAAQQRR